ncbi:hypothetical protein C0J52_14056, partial [Blattella germanica]
AKPKLVIVGLLATGWKEEVSCFSLHVVDLVARDALHVPGLSFYVLHCGKPRLWWYKECDGDFGNANQIFVTTNKFKYMRSDLLQEEEEEEEEKEEKNGSKEAFLRMKERGNEAKR